MIRFFTLLSYIKDDKLIPIFFGQKLRVLPNYILGEYTVYA